MGGGASIDVTPAAKAVPTSGALRFDIPPISVEAFNGIPQEADYYDLRPLPFLRVVSFPQDRLILGDLRTPLKVGTKASTITAAMLTGWRVHTASPISYDFSVLGSAHSSALRCVSLSGLGSTFLAVAEGSNATQLADTSTGRVISEVSSGEVITQVCLASDGRLLITLSSSGHCVQWDSSSRKRLRELPALGAVCAIGGNSDSLLALGTFDHTVQLWDARSGDMCRVFEAHTSVVGCVVFAPRGSLIATATTGEAIVWVTSTGVVRHVVPMAGAVPGMAFSRDARRLMAIDDDGLHAWDVDFPLRMWTHPPPGPLGQLTAVAVGCAEAVIVATSDCDVVVLNPRTGEEELRLRLRGVPWCIATATQRAVSVIGDRLGNLYRLKLKYSSADKRALDIWE